MKRILLTGATGLIGGTIYKTLSPSYEVIRLGRRSSCEIQADLSKPESLADLDLSGFLAVVHCAGVTDEDFKLNAAAAYIQSTLGLGSLIHRAITGKVRLIFYFSTMHVYGSQVGCISEDSPPNPLSDYAIAHYAAEQILRRHSSDDSRVFVFRPNAVFGVPPAMDMFDRWSLIPYSFPLEAVYRQKITLRSAGQQRRNFVGTEDLAAYVQKLLGSESSIQKNGLIEAQPCTVINPIGRETLSVYDFAVKCAQIYERLTGKRCVVERPEPAKTEPGSDFVFRSKYSYHSAAMNLDEYLTTFIRRVLEDLKDGRTYA